MTSYENAYLKRNVDHLRNTKHKLERQVQNLESRMRSVQAENEQYQQYKTLYEQAQMEGMGSHTGMELSNLHQQLLAVQMLKDALNTENLELQQRLSAMNHSEGEDLRTAACVICMDNLANLV